MKIFFIFENLYKGSSNMHEISLRPKRYMKTPSGWVAVVLPKLKLPALSLSPYPTGRDTSFIVCPTYSNFTSVTDQIELARATNLLVRVSDESGFIFSAKTLARNSDIFFSTFARTNVPLTYASHPRGCWLVVPSTYGPTRHGPYTFSGKTLALNLDSFFFCPSRDKKIPLT